VYAIIDIETTGGNPSRDKITEIALYVHDGEKVVDEFVTLINPERKIPPFITRMTGITDQMVAHAPKFYEVAKTIVEITREKVFVAHNASFDYNFVKNEFRSLGYNFHCDKLCTVKLSRKLIPGKPSYSLGRLCRELNIEIKDRHRAKGDAMATVKLFELLLGSNPNGLIPELLAAEKNSRQFNSHITWDMLEKIPSKTGVYYFFNEKGKVIYIGKSKNIRQRILNHLGNGNTEKSINMADQISRMEYEVTGSELAALLKESDEIKTHQPLFNRRQRRCFFSHGLYAQQDTSGYITLKIEKARPGDNPIICFSNRENARNFLFELVGKFNLCQNLSGLYATSGACFQYAVKICKGACIGVEFPEAYNQRVNEAIAHAALPQKNFILIDKGRNPHEKFLVMIENGKFAARGFLEVDSLQLSKPAQFKEYLEEAIDNKDNRQIISGFIRNRKVEQIINF